MLETQGRLRDHTGGAPSLLQQTLASRDRQGGVQ